MEEEGDDEDEVGGDEDDEDEKCAVANKGAVDVEQKGATLEVAGAIEIPKPGDMP